MGAESELCLDSRRNNEPRTYAQTLRTRIDQLRDGLDRRARGEPVSLFVRTGLKSWDENGGIGRGELTVIGAATGDGKSIVKLHLASVAAADGLRVLMIDMEDPGGKTADRTLSRETGLNSRRMEGLQLDEFDLECITRAYDAVAPWAEQVHHFEGGRTTAEVLELMTAREYDLMLIDYAQAFPEDAGKNMERTVAEFAWKANEAAKKTNAAVVVFSQLSRQVEQRGYEQLQRTKFKNPEAIDVTGFCPSGLTDIAWAKELGEKAKCIMYLFRPGKVAQRLHAKGVKDNRMQVIVAKRNFGSEAQMIFAFDGPTATISDIKG